MRLLRVAAVHACPPPVDLEGALELAEAWIGQAGREGAQVVCFPEAFLGGFPHWLTTYPPAAVGPMYRRHWDQAVEPTAAAPAVRRLGRAAADAATVVVMGATARSGTSMYNALLAVDADGRYLGHRRKLVPTASERQLWGFSPVDDVDAWPTVVGDVTGLMCWEHALSLPREILARTGARVHAAAWPGLSSLPGYRGLFHEQVGALVRAHALATGSFVVSAMSPLSADAVERIGGMVGRDSDLLVPAPAWSAVVAPSGGLVAEREGDDDGLLVADIEPDAVVDAARVIDADGHSARDDLFTVLRHRRAGARADR